VEKNLADLGALQRLQQGLRGELSCDWPQVQPLQLVQHPINVAPCRFIGKQLTFDRLIGQQHVEKTSVRTNTKKWRRNIVSQRACLGLGSL